MAMREKSNSPPGDVFPQANPRGPQPQHHASVLASSSSSPTLDTGRTPITLVSSATSLSQVSGTRVVTSAKAPIPRLRSSVAPRHHGRTFRACERCRQRKAKCSGDSPICRQCDELRVACMYTLTYNERMKRQLNDLSQKMREYESMLRETQPLVESEAANRIKTLLQQPWLSEGDSPMNVPRPPLTIQNGVFAPLEPRSPWLIESLETTHRVEEDFNLTEQARATGYHGQCSDITWLERVHREAEQQRSRQPKVSKSALHTFNYHLDDLDIKVREPVQLYWMPTRQLADQYLQDYLNTVHPYFPIINRPLFCAQYGLFFDSASLPSYKWLAILNMIFAIAAKHAHFIAVPGRGDIQDHQVYLARARMLSMSDDALFSHPDLQQIQVEALIAFYLLSSDQVNRAWRISALAVRSAIALGINLNNNCQHLTEIEKEVRNRLWWCLYTVEHMLGIMTGRATCARDAARPSPLPIPFDDEQLQKPSATQLLNSPKLRDARINAVMASSQVRQGIFNISNGNASNRVEPCDPSWLHSLPTTSGLFFLYHCDLAILTEEIVYQVYLIDRASVPWAQIESRIRELGARVDSWHSSLPMGLRFAQMEDDDQVLYCHRLNLALQYYSARILLGRPWLDREEEHRRGGAMEKLIISHEIAAEALDAAIHILNLIPESPDAVYLYKICQWWRILHYIMQATTTIFLELSFGRVQIPGKDEYILQSVKRAVRLLFSLADRSISSRRAWQFCDTVLRRLAIGNGYDVSDIPSPDR